MSNNFVRKILFIILFFFSSFLFSEERTNAELTVEEARGLYSLLENIKEQKSLFPEEVNANNLKAMLKKEYADGTTLYEKNPYVLSILKCLFIEIRPKNNLIYFETFVSSDPSMTSEECIKIINDWNSGRSFSIVSYEENQFHIQYFLTYKGGLHSDNLNDTIEWIFSSSFYFEDYVKEYLKKKAATGQ